MKKTKQFFQYFGRLLNKARQRKHFRVFARQLMNASAVAFAGYQAVVAGRLPVDLAFIVPIVFAFVNSVVKYLNVTVFNDLGVEKIK